MARNIDQDLARFREIVRGKVRQQLRKYISNGEMIGRKGRELVSIPVPNIDIPHFRHGQKGSGGAGQGDGEIGQPIGKGQGDQDGPGKAGDQPGGHVREVEVTLDQLAEMLGKELELPNIIPKGKDSLSAERDKYNSIHHSGPESLRHFKRTYKNALRRMIASQDYNPVKPIIIPTREDQLYRGSKTVSVPRANAAIIYMMDVSGSMTDDQKEIVRTESFWIDTWLQSQYDGIQTRYIIHDAAAREVDEDTFYHTRESGGTRISSAYEVARKIISTEYPAADWNIYCFQFSDGDNWGEDNKACVRMLTEDLIPNSNLFCYGQVESPYGSGDYLRELRKITSKFENLVLSEIPNKDAIYQSIKTFLGKGK
jgi:uncharacterized sporulation protein YeaH/YhbH (DUF444 family)